MLARIGVTNEIRVTFGTYPTAYWETLDCLSAFVVMVCGDSLGHRFSLVVMG